MPYNAITSHFYDGDDGFKVKIEKPPVYEVFTSFLYEEIKKGAFPKYSIKSSDRSEVLYYTNLMVNTYNVKSTGNINKSMSANEIPVTLITNLETGELIDV